MNKYLEAEKRLAELLGWDGLTITNPTFGPGPAICITNPRTGNLLRADIPEWTRDNAAAFALMVKHGCYPIEYGSSIGINGSMIGTCINVADHSDKETAVRYAIVMAVIAKLEA